MMPPYRLLIPIALAIHARCMLIPQDIEVLDGYEFEGPPEIYPDETYFEARSLADSLLLKAIRNKRSYHVLQSPGLHSHFQIDSSNPENLEKYYDHNQSKLRAPRSIDNIAQSSRAIDTIEETESETPPSLPTPEKQVMDTEYYTKGNWNVQTFNTDYSTQKSDHDEVDSVSEASIHDGVKSRQPRVNFITQPKKNGNDEDRSKDSSMTNYMSKLPPISTKSRYQKFDTRSPETYPSQTYDQYLRRYDRYDEDYSNYSPQRRYDPYEEYYLYRKRYDPYDSYSPRMPTYPDEYYNYPDRRFDIPEPRDSRPIYSNDIYERPHSYTGSYDESQQAPTRRRNRIIYYAHLPEVVRAPPTVDLTYRHARDHRFDSYYPPPSNNYPVGRGSAIRDRKSDYVKREKKEFRSFEPAAAADKPESRSENRRE